MPELKIRPASHIPTLEFCEFTRDVAAFLEAFTPELLAKWMGKDAGNISKKLNGIEPITRKYLIDFYRTIGPILVKLKAGLPAYQIELEMMPDDEMTIPQKRNLWEELRLIKESLAELEKLISTFNYCKKESQG